MDERADHVLGLARLWTQTVGDQWMPRGVPKSFKGSDMGVSPSKFACL